MVTVVLIPKPEAIKTLVRRRPSDCVVDRLLKPDNCLNALEGVRDMVVQRKHR